MTKRQKLLLQVFNVNGISKQAIYSHHCLLSINQHLVSNRIFSEKYAALFFTFSKRAVIQASTVIQALLNRLPAFQTTSWQTSQGQQDISFCHISWIFLNDCSKTKCHWESKKHTNIRWDMPTRLASASSNYYYLMAIQQRLCISYWSVSCTTLKMKE